MTRLAGPAASPSHWIVAKTPAPASSSPEAFTGVFDALAAKGSPPHAIERPGAHQPRESKASAAKTVATTSGEADGEMDIASPEQVEPATTPKPHHDDPSGVAVLLASTLAPATSGPVGAGVPQLPQADGVATGATQPPPTAGDERRTAAGNQDSRVATSLAGLQTAPVPDAPDAVPTTGRPKTEGTATAKVAWPPSPVPATVAGAGAGPGPGRPLPAGSSPAPAVSQDAVRISAADESGAVARPNPSLADPSAGPAQQVLALLNAVSLGAPEEGAGRTAGASTDPGDGDGLARQAAPAATLRTLSVQLHPDHLGSVVMTVQRQDGKLTVTVAVGTVRALRLLERDRGLLDAAVTAAGGSRDALVLSLSSASGRDAAEQTRASQLAQSAAQDGTRADLPQGGEARRQRRPDPAAPSTRHHDDPSAIQAADPLRVVDRGLYL